MPDTVIDVTCTNTKCGHRRAVPRELFQQHPIRWVRCGKCGSRSPAPRVAPARRKSNMPLVVGACSAVLFLIIGVIVVLGRPGVTVPVIIPPAPEDPMAKAVEAKEEVEQHVANLQPAITRFKSDRDELKSQLQGLGIAASGDLAGNRKAQLIAKELLELMGQLRVMEKKELSYEQAKVELASVIRRLDRKTVIDKLGLTEEELQEVSETLDTIDMKIQMAEEDSGSALTVIEADAALDDLLSSSDGGA